MRKALDIGSGLRPRQSDSETHWYSSDIRNFPNIDYVFNIGTDKFPFTDNELDELRATHVLEHLYPEQLFHCMDECFRILKPDGFFHIEVPLFGTSAWNIHPDHKMHWTRDMVGFFQVPADYDRHGYLNGFWHIEFLPIEHPEHLKFRLYPNKIGIKRYPYKEIKRADEEEL